ncbi:MAG: hypothetical protein QHG99_04430 [Methanomicrobiales archaeon]|nr:hypothetical protein [Methanomicrobiales archaeon]
MNGNNGEEGQLSIDFLIGFTIFMLGLIMVANMIPGLMVGLRRTTAIDYDAVAYRTGAILVEDPGWPLNPMWATLNNYSIQRFGLAIDRETPNVLSRLKINKFFGKDIVLVYPDDYRSRLVFSDYPYHLNITMTEPGNSYSVGEPLPDLNLSGYGYIRRVVRIKEYPYAELNLNESYMSNYCVNSTAANATQNFTIRMDFSKFLVKNLSPAYQFNPQLEPINITIYNFGSKLNNTGNDTMGWLFNGSCHAASPEDWENANLTPPDNATLKSISFWKNGAGLPVPNVSQYNLTVSGIKNTNPLSNLNQTLRHNDTLSFILYSGVFPLDESTIMDVVFTFQDTPPRTLINGTYEIDYNKDGVLKMPDLREGWLEVAVW